MTEKGLWFNAPERELRSIDNREYLLKLSDGPEHRSSRTYASRLEEWLSTGKRE